MMKRGEWGRGLGTDVEGGRAYPEAAGVEAEEGAGNAEGVLKEGRGCVSGMLPMPDVWDRTEPVMGVW